MPSGNQSIQDSLLAANVALENAITDTEILGLLSEFGYDAAKINAGKVLYNSAQDKFQQQKTEYGEQYAASEEMQTKWDAANAVYMKHVKVGRVALQSDYGAFLKLGLEGARKRTLSGWYRRGNFILMPLAMLRFKQNWRNLVQLKPNCEKASN